MGRRRKQQSPWWYKGIWMTRTAAGLGFVAIVAGVSDPRLLLNPLLGTIAVVAVLLAAIAIVLDFWGISLHSRRFQKPVFWLALLVNLGIVSLVGALYLRAIRLGPPPGIVAPNAQEPPQSVSG